MLVPSARSALLFVLLFAAAIAADLAWIVRDPSPWMLPAALAGWYLADFASGAVHLWMDYRPCPTGVGLSEIYFYQGSRESAEYLALRDAAWSRIGPVERLVYDFKNHHPRPDALGRRSMLVQLRSIVPLTLPCSILLAAAGWLLPVPGWAGLGLAVMLVGATFAQYFHGTLHRADVPPTVRAMRRLRLLCTPGYHRRHHDTLTCDFATISGWSNPLLNHAFDALRRRGWLADEGLEPQG